MAGPERLPPLEPELRDWLDGGPNQTRAHGAPLATESHAVLLGTRLEELARLASIEPGDGASGIGIDLDAFVPPLPGIVEPNLLDVLLYLYSGGAAAVERHVYQPFTVATPSPLALATQATDEIVVRTSVLVLTAFNGATPILEVGTPAVPGRILAAGEVRPKRVAQYESREILLAPVTSTPLRLTIAPSGSSVGAGVVILTLRKV